MTSDALKVPYPPIMKGYDLIGDIHGHFNELEALLRKLGYAPKGGTFHHPGRRAVFIGDFIDRGPATEETLRTVRSMVEGGAALAVMGNHEYNALLYNKKTAVGASHLRAHTRKNRAQHRATLEAFSGRPGVWKEYLDWFYTLPLYLDLGGIRVVHACWDFESIAFLEKEYGGRLNRKLLVISARRGRREYHAVDAILKGREVRLPRGFSITDKEGTVRRRARIKWWGELLPATYRDIVIEENTALPALPVPPGAIKGLPYGAGEKPVFFGHYWFSGRPRVLAPNAACLDYSVALGGKLVAYQWEGESRLNDGNFVFQRRLGATVP